MICKNCKNPIKETRYGLRHVGNRSLWCDTVGNPPSKGILRWAELDDSDTISPYQIPKDATPKLNLTDTIVQVLVTNQNISMQGQAEAIVDVLIEKGWVSE